MSALADLRLVAESCTACTLSKTRNKVVFGEGASDADLMFVGEAPGKNEDLRGEPFVGAAGRLLDQLLEEAGIARERVYIANVVKCRPPGNRDPRPEEIESCKGYLRSQLELVDPHVVVTLGNFATKLLLKTETGITRLRGTSYRWWRDKVLVPTYHPAAALRGGDRITDLMREDFDIMRAALERASDTAPSEHERVSAAVGPYPQGDPEQLGLFG
ncbi:MAG TPA: uracil-DNA glycosylase [Acidimicrobiia bacterium]|nr:uracil-DNA glycosylase [Acidimicrobiia bacterium]